jgi:hypothetical protein
MMRSIILAVAAISAVPAPLPYLWLDSYDPAIALGARIPPPKGVTRPVLAGDSFGAWLRGLPLEPGRPAVHLFDGSLERHQNAHAAVVDIDVGAQDLQQCADAVIRLRAEFLFAAGRGDRIRVRFENGGTAAFNDWARAERPQVRGSEVTWKPSARAASDHAALTGYLAAIFTYASIRLLAKELDHVPAAPRPPIVPKSEPVDGGPLSDERSSNGFTAQFGYCQMSTG